MRSEEHTVVLAGVPSCPTSGFPRGEGAGHPSQMPRPLYQAPNEKIHNSAGGQRSETQHHWEL